MKEFNQINIENDNQLDNLINKYTKMIKEHQKYLVAEIKKTIYIKIDTIEKNKSIKLGDIEKNLIERLIDKHLILELEYTGKNTINTISEELSEKYNLIKNKQSKKNKDKSILFNQYTEEIKKTLQNNPINWLDKITGKFIDILMNELSNILKINSNISEKEFNSLIKDLKKELSNIFDNYQQQFNNDYNNILKDFINQKLIQMKDLLNNKKINNYLHIVNISNHEIIEEKGIYYIKNKLTSKKIEILFEDNIIKSKDNKIKYTINDYHQGYIDNENNIRIVIHQALIKTKQSTTKETLITLVLLHKEKNQVQKKEIISFSKNIHNYKFYYNYKQTNNIKVLKYIIETIKQNAPGVYDILIKDQDFEQVLELINDSKLSYEKSLKK